MLHKATTNWNIKNAYLFELFLIYALVTLENNKTASLKQSGIKLKYLRRLIMTVLQVIMHDILCSLYNSISYLFQIFLVC